MRIADLFKKKRADAVKTGWARYRELVMAMTGEGDLPLPERDQLLALIEELQIDPDDVAKHRAALDDHAASLAAAADAERIPAERRSYEAASKRHNEEFERIVVPLDERARRLNATAAELDRRQVAAQLAAVRADQLVSENYRLFKGEDRPEAAKTDGIAEARQAAIENPDRIIADRYAGLLGDADIEDLGGVKIDAESLAAVERAAERGHVPQAIADKARRAFENRRPPTE